MSKLHPRKLTVFLFAAVIILSITDIKLAHSHLAKTFHLFRKDHQSYMVFIFGITFWAFVLALPLSTIRFRSLVFRKRYFLWVPLLMLVMELAYLFTFLFRSLFH
ncbi:MAG: hypothetical protein ACHQRM_06130 [Bacteroidia bacterium]